MGLFQSYKKFQSIFFGKLIGKVLSIGIECPCSECIGKVPLVVIISAPFFVFKEITSFQGKTLHLFAQSSNFEFIDLTISGFF